MTDSRRPRSRRWLALGIAALALLLSGCVYLRLLELKKQLKDFDTYFALQTRDGVGIVCHEPVLHAKDVRWIGLLPEQVKKLGQAEQWQVRWVKQLPLGIIEPARYDIVLDLGFVNNRLNRIAIPERYFTVMPKDFLVGVIKSLGGGQIDQAGRRIEASISEQDIAAARPNLPDIDKLLGRPSEENAEGPHTIVRYRYIPATQESRAGVFDMHLRFHTESGELLHWQGRTPIGNIDFHFAPSASGEI